MKTTPFSQYYNKHNIRSVTSNFIYYFVVHGHCNDNIYEPVARLSWISQVKYLHNNIFVCTVTVFFFFFNKPPGFEIRDLKKEHTYTYIYINSHRVNTHRTFFFFFSKQIFVLVLKKKKNFILSTIENKKVLRTMGGPLYCAGEKFWKYTTYRVYMSLYTAGDDKSLQLKKRFRVKWCISGIDNHVLFPGILTNETKIKPTSRPFVIKCFIFIEKSLRITKSALNHPHIF